MRVLAADLGRALGTVAHLERLRRTAVGDFRVDGRARARRARGHAGAAAGRRCGTRSRACAPSRSRRMRCRSYGAGSRGRCAGSRAATTGEAALVIDDAGAVAALIEVGAGRLAAGSLLGA